MVYAYMAAIVLLVLGVIGIFLYKAQSSQKQEVVNARQKRYELHEHAVIELTEAKERGDMDNETYQWELDQLNQRLVNEMTDLKPASNLISTGSNKHWFYVFLLIPLCVGGLYFFLGQSIPDPARTLQKTGDVGQFLDQIERLEIKVQADPDNLEQLVMLARSYRVMGRYAEAVIAYGKAWQVIQDDASELALFAEVLALDRGAFKGKPDELLAQAQAIDANNLDVMMLMGQSAIQQGRYKEALSTLIPLKKELEADGEETEWLQLQIDDIEQLLAK